MKIDEKRIKIVSGNFKLEMADIAKKYFDEMFEAGWDGNVNTVYSYTPSYSDFDTPVPLIKRVVKIVKENDGYKSVEELLSTVDYDKGIITPIAIDTDWIVFSHGLENIFGKVYEIYKEKIK